jgi:drug/metabolite transporter (DMT)-like permease
VLGGGGAPGHAGGWVRGATATVVVGASFPVSQALTDYPYAAGQCLRYALGALILTALLKGRLGRPTGREFALLFGVAAVGMTAFNLAILGSVDRIGATNVGVIVGAAPVLLALAGSRAVLGPALIVVAGAAIVNGADPHLDALGAVLALGALAAEVGFTLLAAPLLPRLGPLRTAAWAAWIATAQLALIHPHFPTPSSTQLAAIAYLAVFTTAVAFVLWFGAVQRLGTARAGLLVGLMPVAATVTDTFLNGRTPSPADLAGTALVAVGVAVGATRPTARAPRGGTRAASAASTAGTSSTCPAASSSPAAALPGRSSHR